jgi:hypothetical protein
MRSDSVMLFTAGPLRQSPYRYTLLWFMTAGKKSAFASF